MQSDESTPKAFFLLNLWEPREWRFSGVPKKNFFILYFKGSLSWPCFFLTIGVCASSVQDFGTNTPFFVAKNATEYVIFYLR